MQTYRGWWPTVEQATPLLTSYHAALEATYHLEARPDGRAGGPAFQTAFTNLGTPLSPERVKKGYERLVNDLVPFTMGEWFGVLTPILLSPGLALLAGRFLPGASGWMTAETVTERSLTELITVSDGIGSITPFIYSMIMWANVDDQPGEPFASALWTFLLRIGLVAGWIPSIGSKTDDPSPGLRWGMAGGMLAIDVYALVRLLTSLGGRQPGPAVAFGVQNIPGIMTLVTLIQAGIIKGVVAATKEAGADDDGASVAGWVTWALVTLGLWLGAGLPIANALSNGGGWMSWFATDELPTLRGALAQTATPADTQDGAAVFDDSTLWHDPASAAPSLADLRYPTGGRPLVKVWRAGGSAEMEIAHDGHLVKIRSGANVTDIVIGPGKRTVDDIVTALTAVPGVLAAPSDAGVHYDLPWPATVQDPADESDPRPPDSDPAHAAFVKIPDDPDKPYVLRHAADEDLTTRYGSAGPRRSPFDGRAECRGMEWPTPTTRCSGPQPISPCSSGSAPRPGCALSNRSPPTPTLVPAAPAVAGPIGAVSQVFRDWNLDHRRVNEWRALVAGGASARSGAAGRRCPRRGRPRRRGDGLGGPVAGLAPSGE